MITEVKTGNIFVINSSEVLLQATQWNAQHGEMRFPPHSRCFSICNHSLFPQEFSNLQNTGSRLDNLVSLPWQKSKQFCACESHLADNLFVFMNTQAGDAFSELPWAICSSSESEF